MLATKMEQVGFLPRLTFHSQNFGGAPSENLLSYYSKSFWPMGRGIDGGKPLLGCTVSHYNTGKFAAGNF
jgi:hypothetical protein